MKATNIFDVKRFGRLMTYDLKLNGTSYLLKLSALMLLLYIWLLTQMRQNPGQFMWKPLGDQVIMNNVQGYLSSFFIGLIFLGTFIGTSFSGLGNKVQRTLFLQLPASTTEKYLYALFIRVVIGTGLFFLIFWIDARLALLTCEHIHFGNLTMYYNNGIVLKPDAFDFSMIFNKSTPWVPIVFAFISLGTYLFACPLFFRKMQLLKSILIFFLSIFMAVCFFVMFSHLFYPDQIQGFNVHLDEVLITKKYNNIDIAVGALVYVSWIFFLLAGFFRLKELTL